MTNTGIQSHSLETKSPAWLAAAVLAVRGELDFCRGELGAGYHRKCVKAKPQSRLDDLLRDMGNPLQQNTSDSVWFISRILRLCQTEVEARHPAGFDVIQALAYDLSGNVYSGHHAGCFAVGITQSSQPLAAEWIMECLRIIAPVRARSEQA